MSGEDLEVPVRMENRHGGSDGGRGNEAIDQLPDGLTSSTACTVERGSLFVIGWFGRNEGSSSEQPAKVAEMLLIPCASQHLHPDGVARGDLAVQEGVDAVADCAVGVAEELDPGRGVNEDHPARSVRISSRSPFHPDPRRLRALSRLNGSPATVRNAKLTASRLVAR